MIYRNNAWYVVPKLNTNVLFVVYTIVALTAKKQTGKVTRGLIKGRIKFQLTENVTCLNYLVNKKESCDNEEVLNL